MKPADASAMIFLRPPEIKFSVRHQSVHMVRGAGSLKELVNEFLGNVFTVSSQI